MSQEKIFVTKTAIPIAELFPDVRFVPLFGKVDELGKEMSGGSEAHADYIQGKSRLAKLAVLQCQSMGVPISLGGSCLDHLLIAAKGNNPKIFLEKKKNINGRRRFVSISNDGFFYDCPTAPEFDAIHAALNIDLRVDNTDDYVLGTILAESKNILSKASLEKETLARFPKGPLNYDEIYKTAWNILKPKERKKLMLLPNIDSQNLAILRYVFETDLLGIPAMREISGDITAAQIRDAMIISPDKYKSTPVENESLNIVCMGENNMRAPNRCFNVDALTSRLSIDHIPISDHFIIDDLSVNISLPPLPKTVSIPEEAIQYFETGIDCGDVTIMDQWITVVMRSLRKSVSLGVYEYDEHSLQETERLMDKMKQMWGEKWGEMKHPDTVVIKNMRELEVCGEFNNVQTQKMLDKLGLREALNLSWDQYTQIESKAVNLTYMSSLLGHLKK